MIKNEIYNAEGKNAFFQCFSQYNLLMSLTCHLQ